MATVTDTYISPITGITYQLKAFNPQLLYSPQDKRNIKQGNESFYAIKHSDKLALQRKEQEAKRPKVLSEQEAYELALEREKAKQAERQAYADREAEKERQHQEFLNSSPPLVQVTNTNFYVFQVELLHWQQRGYTIIVDSLEAIVPSLFSCQLSAPVASKKK